MRTILKTLLSAASALPLIAFAAGHAAVDKGSFADIQKQLAEGNRRYVEGKAVHPHSSVDYRNRAATADQSAYAVATVVSCSDSRVPVEMLFDAGLLDLFVVRVPGNVCSDELVGAVEYGVAHVQTPLLIVLGHTDCGAVKSMLQVALNRRDGKPVPELEKNLAKLLESMDKPITDFVAARPELKNSDSANSAVIAEAAKANLRHSIKAVIEESPDTIAKAVKEGKVEIIGALYDLPTGKVIWLNREVSSEAELKAATKASSR